MGRRVYLEYCRRRGRHIRSHAEWRTCTLALWQLRHHDKYRYYWIDAICINQQDSAEKSEQVNMMFSIFSRAQMVFISLGGRPDVKASDLFTMLAAEEALENSNNFLDGMELDLSLRIHDLVLKLGTSNYWNRVWIVQEIAASQDRCVLYGDGLMPWKAFDAINWDIGCHESMCKHEQKDMIYPNPDNPDDNANLTGMNYICMVREDDMSAMEFIHILDLFGPRAVADLRDKIFGALSLILWPSGKQSVSANYALTAVQVAVQVFPHLASEALRRRPSFVEFNSLAGVLEFGGDGRDHETSPSREEVINEIRAEHSWKPDILPPRPEVWPGNKSCEAKAYDRLKISTGGFLMHFKETKISLRAPHDAETYSNLWDGDYLVSVHINPHTAAVLRRHDGDIYKIIAIGHWNQWDIPANYENPLESAEGSIEFDMYLDDEDIFLWLYLYHCALVENKRRFSGTGLELDWTTPCRSDLSSFAKMRSL